MNINEGCGLPSEENQISEVVVIRRDRCGDANVASWAICIGFLPMLFDLRLWKRITTSLRYTMGHHYLWTDGVNDSPTTPFQ